MLGKEEKIRRNVENLVIIRGGAKLGDGILGSEGYPSSYYNYGGQQYYYCETTSEGYTMGQIPSEYQGQSVTILQVD